MMSNLLTPVNAASRVSGLVKSPFRISTPELRMDFVAPDGLYRDTITSFSSVCSKEGEREREKSGSVSELIVSGVRGRSEIGENKVRPLL